MRIFRSEYFWLSVGSVAFVAFTNWIASVPMTQAEWDKIAASHGDYSTVPLSAYWMGFITPCIIAGAWAVVYRRRHPKSTRELQTGRD